MIYNLIGDTIIHMRGWKVAVQLMEYRNRDVDDKNLGDIGISKNPYWYDKNDCIGLLASIEDLLKYEKLSQVLNKLLVHAVPLIVIYMKTKLNISSDDCHLEAYDSVIYKPIEVDSNFDLEEVLVSYLKNQLEDDE